MRTRGRCAALAGDGSERLRGARRAGVGVVLVVLLAWAGLAAADPGAAQADPVAAMETVVGDPILVAQDGGTSPRELEPAYRAPDPGDPGPYNEREGRGYNSDYLFGLSRSLGRSTIVPAAKAPLFLFTVPLDIVFLPFAAIGGFFG